MKRPVGSSLRNEQINGHTTPISQTRPTQFSLLALLAITGGIGLLLAAVCPMFAALVVSNRLIDDGPHPGDRAIMDQWDAWGFSLKNWGLFVMGLLLMVLSTFAVLRVPNRT